MHVRERERGREGGREGEREGEKERERGERGGEREREGKKERERERRREEEDISCLLFSICAPSVPSLLWTHHSFNITIHTYLTCAHTDHLGPAIYM